MFRKSVKGVALALALSFAMAPAVFADDSTVLVTGGSLTFPSAPTVSDFGAVTLDGLTAQQTTAQIDPFTVVDATGTGAGWAITVQATQFAEWNGTGYEPGGKTLPLGSLTMDEPSVVGNGTTSAPPTFAGGAPWVVGTSAFTFATAAADSGMGAYDFGSATLTLTVPVDAFAKTYRSNVVITFLPPL